MKRIGVDHAFDTAIGALLEHHIDFSCHREPIGGKGLVVVLGVWAPGADHARVFWLFGRSRRRAGSSFVRSAHARRAGKGDRRPRREGGDDSRRLSR